MKKGVFSICTSVKEPEYTVVWEQLAPVRVFIDTSHGIQHHWEIIQGNENFGH